MNRGRDDSLVGDLESLRNLLDETSAADVPAEDAAEPQVPVLDDMVQGTLAIDESPLTERTLDGGGVSSFGDDTIKALLGDEWRQSADKILSAARDAIETIASKWSPQQTTELNQALRVRIDATLEAWLEAVIQDRVDDLRATLLDAIQAEIAQFTAALATGTDERDSDAE